MSRQAAQQLLCDKFCITLPYTKMGNIDSLDLFGFTELMIIRMYEEGRHRWRHVADIGANLGLHSILLSKLGYEVKAYEPDYEHFCRLLDNLKANDCGNVKPYMAAVHTTDGTHRFVRVFNNLTGNHLEGYKNSYGPRETVLVPVVDCVPIFEWADLAKIDCEGNEAELVSTITPKMMKSLDLILEVRNTENAGFIFRHFNDIKVPMWSQKTDWRQVTKFEDMPKMNREGSLFVGHKGPYGV